MTRKVGLFHGSTALAQSPKLVALKNDGGHSSMKVIVAATNIGAAS